MTFTKVELAQEAFWRKCAADPAYFFEHFWYIQHPERGAILFELFPAQKRALEVFQRDRYVITLKARQIGWTTVCAAYAFWIAFFHDDRPITFLSRNEREAIKILAKVKYGYRRLPEWMRKRGPLLLRDNQQEFPLDNGSTIESLPSKSDPARGGTVYLVIVDEWASLENPEDAWASIEPITDVGGRCIGLSTAKGWGNFFHSMWVGAETGTNEFTPIFEPWSARTDRDQEWYDRKKANTPEWLLHQEYPSSAEEAFLKSGNPFFDVDKLASLKTEEGEVGNIVLHPDGQRTFIKYSDGNLELWQYPRSGDRYVIGADVAEGLDYGDFSSAHVEHIRTGEIVAHWHGHVAPDEFAAVLELLGRYYNKALIGVENNNHGLTTCVALKQMKYPNIFYTRTLDERTRKETEKIGWTTSRKTRPLMLDDLATTIREDTIMIHDRETIGELRTFVRDENGKLHGSPFDDRTMSLAITVQMSEYAQQYDWVDDAVREGTLRWWDQLLDDVEVAEPTAIGAHNVRR